MLRLGGLWEMEWWAKRLAYKIKERHKPAGKGCAGSLMAEMKQIKINTVNV